MKSIEPIFEAPYSHTGVQRLIQWLMDSQGYGQFELSKRSGLSPATIFQILNKTEKQVTSPPRRSTLSALGKVIGASVQFDSKRMQFLLLPQFEKPETEARELNILLLEIGNLVMSKRRKLSKEERERIVRVVRALITS